ncbi:MAG: hypothetical protein QXO07_01535 [Candidatus Aenigmatarchaeota archaeon]
MSATKDWLWLIILVIIIGAIFIILLFPLRLENYNLNELTKLIIFEKTYLAFAIVIIAAIIVFIGYLLKKLWIINFGFGVLFVGILLVELYVFFTFVGIREGVIKYEVCENLEPTIKLTTISCILMGYKPVNEDAIELASFLIFGIILPFAVLFSITYGIFFGIGIDKLFGPYGKPIASILAFATAMFGMRQFIGPFLIDLLAYGIWGIFGVLIAFILVGALRSLVIKTFKMLESTKKIIKGETGLYKAKILNDIKEFVSGAYEIIRNPAQHRSEVIDAGIEIANKYINILESMLKTTKDKYEKVEIETRLVEVRTIKNMLEALKNQSRQAPSIS